MTLLGKSLRMLVGKRPPALQVGALCLRPRDGKVLMITSRGTGRWIIPKGWPITGLTSAEAALQEAWEEAGVRAGETSSTPLGQYSYEKRKPGWGMMVDTLIYPVRVTEMRDDFPEAAERSRRWTPPSEAARLVDEPELQRLLLSFRPATIPG